MKMHKLWHLGICFLVIGFTGCASYDPAMQGYAGPTANIADSVQVRTESVANVFAVVEVNGRAVGNTFGASTQASRGQGFKLTAITVDREVPAAPVKLKLKAQPVTGAPIQAMAMQLAGTFHTVEGLVTLHAQQGSRYVVRGELKKDGASVWVEDAVTGQVVTEKVVKRP
jgi:hypothetical protein